MPNTFLTPKVIAREALMQLRNNAVMSRLVHRDYSSEFVAGVGDTISIRKPATFEAKEFKTDIEIQDATETSIDVKMDKHLDVSFSVTSKEMTLDIKDFSKELLIPAMQAFNDKIDKYLLGLEAEITNRVKHAAGTPLNKTDIINTRKFLSAKNVPTTDRRFVFGADAEADFLNIDAFTEADKVGDNGTALREASLGRKFGLDCYLDQNVAETTGKNPNYTPSIAFHKNAFALVTRNLAKPAGAGKAETVSYDGYGLRVVYGYDINKKTDIVSIDMLCGFKTLDKNLAAVLEMQAV